MKKVIILFFLLIFSTTSVQALSWSYSFVVWKGNVYEVTKEKISESDIVRHLGEVKTKPNDMTGSYYGDASNAYPKGTRYFEINGELTETSIAVEVENNQWVKAVYVHKAPFHWMDIIIKVLPILIILLIVIAFILHWKNRRT
ncbi:hypothetical protein [Paenisporosarcina indica]|uniref:hypothetical protein n=1 Tax=Paenisporosarcina indica TaxID=650093 RepID=UPI00094FA58F|nr:hypothetical protein [Paenisporosarcina indica]